MNIVLISSSPHREKSATFLLSQEVLRGARDTGATCETIHLEDFQVFFCKHCEACHRQILHCSLPDDVPKILEKMLQADGIILASPNYINQVNAPMKALFDRSAHFIHCKRLIGKYVAGVVTSGSGLDQTVLDYLKFYAHTCGAQYSGGVSSMRQINDDKKAEAYALGKRLASDIKEKSAYPEQIDFIERAKRHFGRIIKMRKDEWIEEYEHWVQKGWLK